MAKRKQLKLGHMIEGAGRTWTDWRHPDAQPGASTDFKYYASAAKLAEQGKFDFLFIADSLSINAKSSPHYLNRFEPITILSALAAVTEHIGLVATLSVSYSEPFNVARQFASLDHISGGRAGWNVVTSWLEGSADNFGKAEHLAHDTRYRLATEYLDVVQGLWDSYEDDAFPRDKAAGVFLDKSKQHALNHKGRHFSVAGPLALSRSPQGQPVIFQAGVSGAGRDLGAKIAEGVFAGVDTFEDAQEYYADLKARAAALGRDPDHISVLPGIAPIIADTDEEAQALAAAQASGREIDKLLVELGRAFGYHDFKQYPLDGPFPDVSRLSLNSYKGHAERIVRVAQAEALTVRQTAERFGRWKANFVGSPQTVADEIERWFVGRAVDGFILHVTGPREFALFREKVVPLLQAKGLFRTEYEHDTLRGHLGLPVPEHRWAKSPDQIAAE